MPTDESGVTELLRRASDGLTPDVDRLVGGGITRGRARQRRARIGTTVASLAVIGVIGTLAAVVPQLGDPDGRGAETEVADRRDAVTTRAADPDRPPPADELRPLVPPQQMADALREMTGATEVRSVEVDQSGQDLPRLYYATVEGAQVSFRIRWYNNPVVVQDGGQPLAPSVVCEPAPDVDCTTLPDGSRLLRQEAYASGGGSPAYQERTVTLGTADGWQIDVIARNTAVEKEGEVVADAPVLTIEQLEALATSDAWYA